MKERPKFLAGWIILEKVSMSIVIMSILTLILETKPISEYSMNISIGFFVIGLPGIIFMQWVKWKIKKDPKFGEPYLQKKSGSV